jgi:hypothetical protein
MSKHTPGPWFIEDGRTKKIDHLNVFHVNDKTPGAASSVIAKVTCRVTWHEQQTANARLISAAPDLLAALIRLMGETTDLQDAFGAAKQARAAIAKAKGETP